MGDSAIYTQDFTRGLPSFVKKAPSFADGYVYMYWIVGLVIISGLSYVMYTPLNRQVSATLFWILGFMIVYFYYVKWFRMGKNTKNSADSLTPCPDYLTQYMKPAVGIKGAAGYVEAKPVCLDFVGVSRNGALKKCDKPAAECLADPDYVFEPPEGAARNVIANYRDEAAIKGLLWTSVLGDI